MFIDGIMGISIFLIVLATIFLCIISAISISKNKENFQFDTKQLITLYAYLMSFLTLLFAAYGLARSLYAGFSFINYHFSYQVNGIYTEPIYKPSDEEYQEQKIYEPIPYEEQWDEYEYNGTKYHVKYSERNRDILIGVSLLLSCGFLFLLHQYIINNLKTNETVQQSEKLFKKFYIFLSLVIYGIISIISLPVSIFQTLDFFINTPVGLQDYSRSIPGSAIAVALCAVPIWLAFLKKALSKTDEK